MFHFNPDGDAVGSALALYHYFKDDGYEVSVVSPNPFPSFLHWMKGSDQIIIAQENLTKARKAIKEADMLFVVDMNAPHRAGQDLQNTIAKCYDDSEGYMWLTWNHVITSSLAYPDDTFFKSGTAAKVMRYCALTMDNLGAQSAYGDSSGWNPTSNHIVLENTTPRLAIRWSVTC